MSLLMTLAVAPYLAPTGIAAYRNHPETTAIFLINLFFGWTVVGWIVSLVWSLSGDPPRRQVAADGDEVVAGRIRLQGRDPRHDQLDPPEP